MSANRSDLMPNLLTIPIGSQAASIVLPGAKFQRNSRIKSVSLINQAGISLDATNHLHVDLQDSAGNALASIDTNAGALTANVPADLTVNPSISASSVCSNASHSEVEVPAGTSVIVNVVKNGTSVPTLAVLQIEWYPV